jgi:hypothetical protein
MPGVAHREGGAAEVRASQGGITAGLLIVADTRT